MTTLAEYSLVLVFRTHLVHFRGASALQCLFLRRVSDVFRFDLEQVELLGSENRTRSRDADPTDEGLSRDLVVLHGIEADEGTRAAETRLAVDGDSACVGVLEVLLTGVHELVNDELGWGRSIGEDHVIMGDALAEEGCAIVFGFVQADNPADIQVFEDVDITGGGVAIAMHGVPHIDRSHEGQELAGDDPVEVAVLDLLIMLVLSRIERLEVIPSELHGPLEALEAVHDGALVLAGAPTRIPIRMQVRLVALEQAEGLMGIYLENHDHKGTHKVGRVRDLGEICALCIVVYPGRALKAVALEKLLELTAEAVRHR